MNVSLSYENLIKENLAAGVDDVTVVAGLIEMGMEVLAAQQLLIKTKKKIALQQPVDVLSLLPSNWVVWLQENIQRNCDPNELVQILNKELKIDIEQGFELIRKIQDADFVPVVEPETTYEYEKPFVQIKGNSVDIEGHVVNVVMSVNKPPVLVFENVLTHDECDELIRLSQNKMKRSAVVDNETGGEVYDPNRKSAGTYFNNSENDLIKTIERRVALLMNQPIENGEGFQILNYQIGGEYKPHFDYFDPAHKGSRRHLANGGQRVSTMVLYLNDVESGGQTAFPDLGLTVNAKKGSAVYFEYCNSKGQVDKKTLHAGCPVESGEKWIATKWVRQGKFG